MNMDMKQRAHELNVAYIGGGSRGWAWGFMMDLAMDADMCGTVKLYDIDRSAAQRNEIIGNKISAHPDAAARWQYEVSDSLQDALDALRSGKIHEGDACVLRFLGLKGRFGTTAFKREHAKMYKQYTKQSASRRFSVA